MKTLDLLMIALFAVLTTSTNAQLLIASHCIGGDKNEYATQVIASQQGGFILVGYSLSSQNGDVADSTSGMADLWVVRLNEAGSIEWQELFGGSDNDFATAVAELPSGEIAISGTTFSNDGDFPDHNGSTTTSDAFLLMLTTTGTKIWCNTFGDDGNDESVGLLNAGNNGIALAVTGVNEGIEGVEGNGMAFWLMKMDVNANIQWRKFYGSGNAQLEHVATCADGGFYFAGRSIPQNGIEGDHEVVLIKADHDGDLVWQNNLGSESQDVAHVSQFISCPDGSVLLGFSLNSINDQGMSCTPHGSFMVAICNADGEWMNTWCYGGDAADISSAVSLQNENTIWIAGNGRSTNGDVPAINGVSDNQFNEWMARLTAQGEITFSTAIGGNSQDLFSGMAIGVEGNVLLAVNTLANDVWAFGQHDVEGDGVFTSDIIFSVYSTHLVNVDVVAAAETSDKIFPNPIDDIITIGITDSNSDDEIIVITDLSGRRVLETTLSESNEIDVSALNAGTYLVYKMNQKGTLVSSPQRLMKN